MHLTDAALAFAEGLGLILSPCILPVLPLVLGASVDGGRRRPFGIVTGFVLAFTFFVLASRWLVVAFHINLDLVKYVSLVLLSLFAVVLLSGKLSEKFSALTQGAANLGGRVSGNGGFASGVAIGVAIGLVWTPCAGPILASVLVQVILQKEDAAAGLVVASFALGAGVPMLVIALLGRKVAGKLGFFTRHTEAFRKGLGVVMLLAVAFIASGASIGTASQTTTSSGMTLEKALPQSYAAPELTGLEGWINSEPLTLASLKGKVVLVDFWTYSCINCVRTLPYLTEWDKKYRDKGLVILGLSAPEFEFEKNADNVRAAVQKNGIRYPVALDNHLATWQAFNNQYWPAHYLIDKEGRVVYTSFGEGDYGVTENNIRFLLGLGDKAAVQADPAQHGSGQTPETYLGIARGERGPALSRGEAEYHYPAMLDTHHWALEGRWDAQSEKIVSAAPGASLRFNFHSPHVYLVLGTASGKPLEASVTLDGKPAGTLSGKDAPGGMVTVTGNTLYELIRQPEAASGLLEVKAHAAGLEAYAFTFGN